MRSVAMVCIAAGVIGVGACSSSSDSITGPTLMGSATATEAKGGGRGGGGGNQDSISVTATWGVAPAGQVTGILAGTFAGAIGFHAEGSLGPISFDSSTGLPSLGGDLVLVHMNSVGILPLGGEFARQFVVEWEDGEYTYRLHYGDPHYAHVVCTDVAADGSCIGAVIDSLVGQFSSDVDSTNLNRMTGPMATLTRREGKRKPVVLGSFEVPFSLTVTPNS